MFRDMGTDREQPTDGASADRRVTRNAGTAVNPDLGLRFGGFRLQVDGPASHEGDDTWDANWLSVTARCESPGAAVIVHCTVLTSWSIERFREGLATIAHRGSGSAYLAAEEPCLSLRLQCPARGGEMRLRAEITPSHYDEGHWFTLPVTRADLDAAIAGCQAILTAYPPHQVAAAD